MPITPEGFDEDFQALVEEIETEIREAAIDLLQALMIGTPVDTGFHRNNWHMDIGSLRLRLEGTPPPSTRAEPLRSLPPLDGSSNGRINAAARFIKAWTVESGNIFVHNSGPAIAFLDDGSSAQADQGILDPAVAAVRTKYGLAG